MASFSYVGTLPASKSLFNRALIVQSYFPDFEVHGESQSDDVNLMKAGLKALLSYQPVECGHAGTVLRFMALRASRLPGEHVLTGSERLFSRPQQELLKILRQLGSEAKIASNQLSIKSRGWKPVGDTLQIHSERSSQFASAVLLNCWQLGQPMHFSLSRKQVSQAYWQMTLSFVRQLGMVVEQWDSDYRVPAKQSVSTSDYSVEMDMSSAFAIASVAVVSGQAVLHQFPESSLQPDHVFTKILMQMGVPVSQTSQQLKISQASQLKPIAINLNNSPDLFPVLAVLCALAEGESHLNGAAHLKYKESHRIEKTAELITKMNRKVQVLEDGLTIEGKGLTDLNHSFIYDTDQDHRLAMAAAVAQKAGFAIDIKNPEVVSKSFPGFWSAVGQVT